MSYIHQLLVHKYRVRVGVVPSNLTGASALSDMDLNYITETITELNQVIAGELSDLSWGTQFFCVISEGNMSWYGDYEKVERYQTSTISFRDYLIELKNFKEQCLAGDQYKTIVGQAFTAIKANPSGTKKWAHGSHYETVINGKIVSLNLSEDDFNLTESQYMAQLKRDFLF
jgi:hypothetical protein